MRISLWVEAGLALSCIIGILPMQLFAADAPGIESVIDREAAKPAGSARQPTSTLYVDMLMRGRLNALLQGQEAQEERSVSLTLQQYIGRVLRTNDRLTYYRLGRELAAESVNNAESVFEPTLKMTLKKDYAHTRNTTTQAAQRSSLTTYENDTNSFNASVAGQMTSGGSVELSYTMDDIKDNLQSRRADGKEFKTYLGVSVTQPLWKNAGSKVTMANIRMAEQDVEVGEQTYRQNRFQIVSKAINAYLDLQRAQERLRIRQQSLQVARDLLEDVRAMVAQGRRDQGHGKFKSPKTR